MRARFSILALVGPLLLISGCNSSNVGPTAEASDVNGPASTASTPPYVAPSLASNPSSAPSRSPAASGAFDAAGFTTTIDNPWFPLVPGTTFTYQGTKDGEKAVETFAVTTGTKAINRATCVVVVDQVSLGGVAAEKLIGYYAQDRDGNVWYFGEDMQELDAKGNVVSTDGSWHAGVDKAKPALIMQASPMVGQTIEHAYTKNDFAVLSLSEKVTVPYGSFNNAVVTKEWSPLEPTVETHKFYAPRVGLVRDVAVKGPTEELVLVKVDGP